MKDRIVLVIIVIVLLVFSAVMFNNIFTFKNKTDGLLDAPTINEYIVYFDNEKLTCKQVEGSCYIIAPKIDASGKKIIGWSKNKEAKTAEYRPQDRILITKKISKFYSIVEDHIEVSKTFKIGNYTVEIENKNLNEEEIIKKLDFIHEKMPFLFETGGKINFLTKETYTKLWENGDKTVGVSEPKTKTVDIVADSKIDSLVIVHELSHNLDWNCMGYDKKETYMSNDYEYYNKYYYLEISKSEALGFNNLFEKYKDLNKKPLRAYSYNDLKEFFADSIASYFDSEYYKSNSLIANSEILDAVSKLVDKINNNLCTLDEKRS